MQWGQWNRGSNQHLGFARINIIGRMIIEGTGASHSAVGSGPPMSATVAVTEYCVLQMAKPLQRVCKHKFIGEEPDPMAAGKLRVTTEVYEARVNQALAALAEFVKIT